MASSNCSTRDANAGRWEHTCQQTELGSSRADLLELDIVINFTIGSVGSIGHGLGGGHVAASRTEHLLDRRGQLRERDGAVRGRRGLTRARGETEARSVRERRRTPFKQTRVRTASNLSKKALIDMIALSEYTRPHGNQVSVDGRMLGLQGATA